MPPAPFAVAAATTPLVLSATEQAALAQSAQSAGYSLAQATAILQTARDQSILLTASVPEPASCGADDHECAFTKACWPCYGDRQQPQCLPCLRLKECRGMPPCESDRACKVCQTLPQGSYRPSACSKLHC